MMAENILPAAIFAAVMSGTPGPANMILMATGASYGFRRAFPFVLGVEAGFLLVLAAAGFGVAALLDGYPALGPVITLLSSGYLLYLAWKIACADLRGGKRAEAVQAVGFRDGLIVHPMNPKAWLMATTAFAQFADPSRAAWEQWGIMSLVFLVAGFPTNWLWCWGGDKILSAIESTQVRRSVNLGLAVSTVAIVAYMAWGQFA